VVTSIQVEGRLEHSISKEPVNGWVNMDQLQSPTDVDIADYVMYDDWIGQARTFYPLPHKAWFLIHKTGYRGKPHVLFRIALLVIQSVLLSFQSFDESMIEVSTGQLVRLPEFSSRLCVGDKGNVGSLFYS
jgi:ubiquitin-conjugating enzyme E2 O